MLFMVQILQQVHDREIGLFFNKSEIVEYGKLINQWVN